MTQNPIVFVHSSDEMYGADRMLLEFLAALPESDRPRVLVLLPHDVQHGTTPLCLELESRGYSYAHVPLPILRRQSLNPPGLATLGRRILLARKMLCQLNPDILVLATSAMLPVALAVPRSMDTKVVLHMQEVWSPTEARVLGKMATRVDQIIAISTAARTSLPPGTRGRSTVVPNCTPDPGPCTNATRPSATGIAVLIASRWNTWKGHEVLLRAWDRAGCPGRLVILGSAPDLGAGVDVPELVRELSNPESVQIRGQVPDIGPEISAADVIVVPSTKPEPFGLVTIEAFARCRPVIGSNSGGLRETVTPDVGWLTEPGSVSELARVLAEIDPSQCHAMGMSARERFEAHYSVAAFRRGLLAALED